MEQAYISTTAIAITGSVDSGKSSFIGVISSNGKQLDDGKGLARLTVAKHEHERESGKTSDISTRSIKIPENNNAISIIDLCGHERYLHTTAFGLSGYYPDYAFVIVSANNGVLSYTANENPRVLPMTEQHMRILWSLNIPICVIITRIDVAPVEIYKITKKGVENMINQFYGKTAEVFFTNNETHLAKTDEELAPLKDKIKKDVVVALSKIENGRQRYFPVITISNKTGFFIDVVIDIVKNLPPRKLWACIDEKYLTSNKFVSHFIAGLKEKKMEHLIKPYQPFNGSIFYIDNVFAPQGISLVITGINRGSDILTGNSLYIGPINNNFVEFKVKTMHNNIKELIPVLKDHYRGTIQMGFQAKSIVRRNQIKKGMIAISSLSLKSNVCYRCEVILTFFSKSVTVKTGYSPVIHMGTIRQSVRIIIDPEKNNGANFVGFTGKQKNFAIATIKFMNNPEYVEPYSIFLIRNGGVHGIGMVLNTLPIEQDNDAKPDDFKIKFRSKAT